MYQRNVSAATGGPRHPARVGRGTSAGTEVVIPAGRRHGAPPSSAGRHAVEAALAGAGTAAAHGEAPHESAAASPLLEHHGETAVLIGLVVEVGVVGLRATLDGGLREKRWGASSTSPRAHVARAESDSRPQ